MDQTLWRQRLDEACMAQGFSHWGVSDLDLTAEIPALQAWLANQYHGQMHYMAEHGLNRANPQYVAPFAWRVISVALPYVPPSPEIIATLHNSQRGYISRYALGRDYHKIMRQRLKRLGLALQAQGLEMDFRPVVDTAPLLERPLAAKAGLGWIGKHGLVLNEHSGSWFFLGELLTNLPLAVDVPVAEQCGKCQACLQICPTQAFVSPYVLDARRCISYLTIESAEPIPLEFREAMGNRIYGCDDCQLICPWTKVAQTSVLADFSPRAALLQGDLRQLWSWDEATFLQATEGSPIRRIGYERWRRNVAVALGNSGQIEFIAVLQQALATASPLVAEHIQWAVVKLTASTPHNAGVGSKTARLIRSVHRVKPKW